MKQIIKTTGICVLFLLTNKFSAFSQAQAAKTVTAWDGMIVAGYVNKGGYINFGGPSIKLVNKPMSISLGMMPTLRFKEDVVASGAKKHSLVTPNLGFGLTFVCKHLAIQLPLYYNGKTAATDGKWNVGVGIGYKF